MTRREDDQAKTEKSMRWFGRKAAGDGARPQLTRTAVAWLGLSTSATPRSYEALVRDGYERKAYAQRAVRIVAAGAGSAPTACRPGGGAAWVRRIGRGPGRGR